MIVPFKHPICDFISTVQLGDAVCMKNFDSIIPICNNVDEMQPRLYRRCTVPNS